MIKTIIFDIGKVITNTNFQLRYTNFANAIGIEPQAVIDYHTNYLNDLLLGNINFEKFLADLEITKPANEVKNIWVQESITTTEVNQELLNLIDKLQEFYVIQSLTNVSELRSLTDEALGLYDHFDHNFLSYKLHLVKPDPKFYELPVLQAQVKPEQAIFIDDNEKFVNAAMDLGIHGIIYKNNQDLINALQKLGIKK